MAALFANRGPSVPSNPDTKDMTKEPFFEMQHKRIMEQMGMSAASWQNNFNRNIQMGGVINDGVGLDTRGGGFPFNSNKNPLEKINQDHVDINTFDRANTNYSLNTVQGELRPRKRNAIPTTLTPEIVNPKNPGPPSQFSSSKDAPAYANITQQKIAKANRDKGTNDSEALRQHYGVAFFNRAPGQSFRYE